MRRIRILPLLVLVLALLAGLALAEEPQVPPPSGTAQQQNLFQAFFDLSRWLQGISRDMTRLAGGISGLALALVMLGVVGLGFRAREPALSPADDNQPLEPRRVTWARVVGIVGTLIGLVLIGFSPLMAVGWVGLFLLPRRRGADVQA